MDKQLIKDCQHHTDKIKVQIMMRSNLTFFMNILFSLRITWDPSIEMLATDGENIMINPKYWLTRTIEGGISDLLHETMHVVLLHMIRVKNPAINRRKYNMAGDYVINLMLLDMNLEVDHTFILDHKYKEMSTEEVYNLLPDPPKDYKPDVVPNAGKPDQTIQEMEERIKSIISTAVTQTELANQWGNVPSNLRRGINEILNPTVNWEQQLINYFSAYDKSDYTWRRPNRRNQELYLPSAHSESMDRIAIVCDCSGSINIETYTKFIAEIQGIINILNPVETVVINFGTEVGTVTHINKGENLLDKCAMENLGGTDVKPPLIKVQELHPAVCVFITDGMFSNDYRDFKPDCDVLWLIDDNRHFNPLFGRKIDLL